ncbi:lipoprotein signal peptidase [Blattabacterium cuenoti]|uniref:lipoprotein signal peptidase n=1 Tax=Blattabacterium cuenoti TaxID=1653831 RepID=UPI00163CD083|nr:lipoprotein signal peptidase [Blattabacterium cuenoti]
MKRSFFIILPIIVLDQLLKIYVKTHFRLGDEFYIFSFFRINFIENPGIAYGFFINKSYGKIILSIIKVILIIIISIFHINNIRKNVTNYIIIPIDFILSGSISNFLDNALYGLLFNSGTVYNKKFHNWIFYSGISTIDFSFKKGYSHFMEGCIVDMFYFPLINFSFPKWIPIVSEFNFQFFQPIFNLSDIFIFIGIILLFFFRNKINQY